MIVFDFDKTLTEKDTLRGFYYTVGKNHKKFFLCRKLLYSIIVLLCAIGIINNTHLKKYGVLIFLNKISKENLLKAAKDYSSQIKRKEKIEKIFYKQSKSNVLICSASFKEYIQYCYPEHTIIASELYYKNGACEGLKVNLYGNKKKEVLMQLGISKIDELYTDSYSDLPLMKISEKKFLIQKNHIQVL